jgi:ubiquinone/menaquinone biosynthesis C-methylase UbiE
VTTTRSLRQLRDLPGQTDLHEVPQAGSDGLLGVLRRVPGLKSQLQTSPVFQARLGLHLATACAVSIRDSNPRGPRLGTGRATEGATTHTGRRRPRWHNFSNPFPHQQRYVLFVTGPSHDDRVRAQFRRQAETFTDTGFAARGLTWIVETIAPNGTEVVLDVACGAAHLGRALAPRVSYVHGLDLVPEMLQQAKRLAEANHLHNLSLLQGDATDLPWIDAQFDLAVCRLTLHQVSDPAAVVREMVRVTKDGGRIAVIDMIADPTPRIAEETNRLERLRDPSHGCTLTAAEITHLIEDAGAVLESDSLQDQRLDLEDWMARTETPAATRDEIRQRLNDEMQGGSPTGLRPARDAEGQVRFVHPWIAAIARVEHGAARRI